MSFLTNLVNYPCLWSLDHLVVHLNNDFFSFKLSGMSPTILKRETAVSPPTGKISSSAPGPPRASGPS